MAKHRRAPVAPATLHPGLTRSSLGSRSRLYIEKYAPRFDDFVFSDTGIMLPPINVAERDRERGQLILATIAEKRSGKVPDYEVDRLKKASRILSRSDITESGCIVDGLKHNQTAARYVLTIAGEDWGSPSFETEDEVDDFRLCDTPECCNTRHYDLEFSRPTLRERRIELDLSNYVTQQDGSVLTLWGDKLPSFAQSYAKFMSFIQQNYPYVEYKDSKLSATAMSQIRIVPITGCWEAWQYYCKPEHGMNWQFDGYGRLYNSFKEKHLDEVTGEITYIGRRGHWLAHRVIWHASGNRFIPGAVLNHKCGYRRCCNPDHIEQVSSSHNNRHGRKMAKARALK